MCCFRLPPEWLAWYQQLHEYRQQLSLYAASKGLPTPDDRSRPHVRRGRSRSKSPSKKRSNKDDRGGYDNYDKRHDREKPRLKEVKEPKTEKEKEKRKDRDKTLENEKDKVPEEKEKPGKVKEKHKKKEKKEKKEKVKKEKKKRKNKEGKERKKSSSESKSGNAEEGESKTDEVKKGAEVENPKAEYPEPVLQVQVENEDLESDSRVVINPNKGAGDPGDSKLTQGPTNGDEEENATELESSSKRKTFKNKNIWSSRGVIKNLADYDSTNSQSSLGKKNVESPPRAAIDYKDTMSPIGNVDLENQITEASLDKPSVKVEKSTAKVDKPEVKMDKPGVMVEQSEKDSLSHDPPKPEKKVVQKQVDKEKFKPVEATDTEDKPKKERESVPVVASSIHRRKSEDVMVKMPELSKWERESDSGTDEDRMYVEQKENKKKSLPK